MKNDSSIRSLLGMDFRSKNTYFRTIWVVVLMLCICGSASAQWVATANNSVMFGVNEICPSCTFGAWVSGKGTSEGSFTVKNGTIIESWNFTKVSPTAKFVVSKQSAPMAQNTTNQKPVQVQTAASPSPSPLNTVTLLDGEIMVEKSELASLQAEIQSANSKISALRAELITTKTELESAKAQISMLKNADLNNIVSETVAAPVVKAPLPAINRAKTYKNGVSVYNTLFLRDESEGGDFDLYWGNINCVGYTGEYVLGEKAPGLRLVGTAGVGVGRLWNTYSSSNYDVSGSDKDKTIGMSVAVGARYHPFKGKAKGFYAQLTFEYSRQSIRSEEYGNYPYNFSALPVAVGYRGEKWSLSYGRMVTSLAKPTRTIAVCWYLHGRAALSDPVGAF